MKTRVVTLLAAFILGGCQVLLPLEAAPAPSSSDVGIDVEADSSIIDASTDGWIADGPMPDAGPDSPIADSLPPDYLQSDNMQPDSMVPDAGPVCTAKITNQDLDCSMHIGCQTSASYWLEWDWSGANEYTVTIDSYTNLYSNNIGYFGSTPGTKTVSGPLTANPQKVQYTMPTKKYIVSNPATVQLKIVIENTAIPGCKDTKYVVVSVN